ncbi:MAG: futalosine hydrolase [Bacteroidota bacterium]
MTKILFVAATLGEITKITEHLEVIDDSKPNLKHYHFQGAKIDMLITGVGMVATTYQLTKILSNDFYTAVYNIGICGCFNRTIPLGTVLNISSDSFPELGAEDGPEFISAFEIGLIEKNEPPFKNGLLYSYHPPQVKTSNNLKQVHGITVKKVHGKEESINETINVYHPDTESMEGAAFLYVCLKEQVPCAQIRAVSNYVERRNRDAWQIETAIENLTHVVMDMLTEITSG